MRIKDTDFPIGYTIDSIKSMKEERIRLTPPLFCKMAPQIEGFKAINFTTLKGIPKHKNNHSELIFLDDIVLYLINSNPKI
jgi:hypothetical protein